MSGGQSTQGISAAEARALEEGDGGYQLQSLDRALTMGGFWVR